MNFFTKKVHFHYMLPSDIFVLIKHVEEKASRMDKNKNVMLHTG